MWRSVTTALALLLALFGCNTSSSVPGKALAGITGCVSQGSPLAISSDPSSIPAGQVPVEGAEVRVLDIYRDVVGTAVTESDGTFLVEDLRSGYLEVEVRVDPASPDPDVRAPVTGISGALIEVNRAYPVSREDAIDAVRGDFPPDARVVASLQPLPAGATVQPRAGDPTTGDLPASRASPAPEYLVFVDRNPHADYAHPVEYLFIDAETGTVTRQDGVFWPPRVNGDRLWSAVHTLYRIDGLHPDEVDAAALDAVTPVATEEVVQEAPKPATEPVATTTTARLQNHNTDAGSIFAILWQASPEPRKAADISRMDLFLRSSGVPPGNIRKPVQHQEGRNEIENSGYRKALNELNAIILNRLAQGLHSTLLVYIVTHGGGTRFYRDFDTTGTNDATVQPGDLALTKTGACKVRVILEFCYADAVAEILAQQFDAIRPDEQRHDYAIYSASAADEYCYSIDLFTYGLFQGLVPLGGRFTSNILDHVSISNGDVKGLLNPAGDDVRDELQTIFGTVDFISGNVYQHPTVRLRENVPAWCREAKPPSTSCVTEVEPNNFVQQATPLGDATCFEGHIDAFTGDGLDWSKKVLPPGDYEVRRISGVAQISVQVGELFYTGNLPLPFTVEETTEVEFLAANGNGPYAFLVYSFD
ncbi:MAG: carboxypeptidase-like regulatory domain-containing protein [Planctomycetota bacterium]|jgi:hypothetical protein